MPHLQLHIHLLYHLLPLLFLLPLSTLAIPSTNINCEGPPTSTRILSDCDVLLAHIPSPVSSPHPLPQRPLQSSFPFLPSATLRRQSCRISIGHAGGAPRSSGAKRQKLGQDAPPPPPPPMEKAALLVWGAARDAARRVMQQCVEEQRRAGHATVVLGVPWAANAMIEVMVDGVMPGGADLDVVAKQAMRRGTGRGIRGLDFMAEAFSRPVYHV